MLSIDTEEAMKDFIFTMVCFKINHCKLLSTWPTKSHCCCNFLREMPNKEIGLKSDRGKKENLFGSCVPYAILNKTPNKNKLNSCSCCKHVDHRWIFCVFWQKTHPAWIVALQKLQTKFLIFISFWNFPTAQGLISQVEWLWINSTFNYLRYKLYWSILFLSHFSSFHYQSLFPLDCLYFN